MKKQIEQAIANGYTFNKREQYFGYPVIRSFYETREIEPYGKIKLLVRVIDFQGVERYVMSFRSQAIAFVPYETTLDLERKPSPLFRQLKREYKGCTPHHDLDGFYIVPIEIHSAFPHDGPVSLWAYERGLKKQNLSARSLSFNRA